MAEIDPLVAEILLKGDDEFLGKIKRVGEEGAENFEKLFAKIEQGASSAEALTGSLGLIEAAFAGLTAATVAFVEQQTELSQKTILLAEAFGTTAGQLQDLEAVFASAGVKVDQFERFANRLTITIAREWPQIAESIKNYSTENDAATLRVSSAILRVKDAQNSLADNSADRFAQMAKDSNGLEAAYLKLQFAAQHAASEQVGAFQAVRGAELSVTAAQQALAALEGRPPSKAEQENLKIAQAQQALDQARRAEADARIAQQEKAAGAALKQRQIEQEYSDLARKAAKDARDDAEQREKDENRVKEAVIARAEAEQKAEKLALTNIASIRGALDGVVKGNKDAATQIDLTKVSVDNLKRAIIAQAAESTKSKNGQPTGEETLIALSTTLHAATDDQISQADRLAIVNRLAGTSMQALGASAAEMQKVLERGPDALRKFSAEAKAIDLKSVQHDIEEFRGALADLNRTISLLSQAFAAAIAPAFTSFLNTIRESIIDSTGTLHLFISGIQALGTALSTGFSSIKKVVEDLGATIDKAFDLAPGRSLQILLGTITVAVGLFATAWVGVPVLIAAAVTALGLISQHMREIGEWAEQNRAKFVAIGAIIAGIAILFAPWTVAISAIVYAIVAVYENWDKVKASIAEAWKAVQDNAIYQFLDGVIERLKQAYDFFAKIFGSAKQPNARGGNSGGGGGGEGSSGDASEAAPPQGFARGGMIEGPGTTTSDSIVARLSRGEGVINAAAIQRYGTDFFHAFNNMTLPGFAQGGLVPAPVRMGGGSGAHTPATSTLNLSIDGRSFNGLKGPKSTIDDLSSYAISRQTSAAGSNPSWMR